MADWANLTNDVFGLITQRIEFMEDYIQLLAVCKSWGKLVQEKPQLPPRFPMVMLTETPNENSRSRRFFSLETSKTYEIELPEATNRACYGAYYGWLLTVGYDLKINLLHPFSRCQVSLPPLLAFEKQYEYDETFKTDEVVDMFVRKVVMSADPLPRKPHYHRRNDDCVVLAIYGELRTLAFARPGNKVWTDISASSRRFDDVAYYKGKFYAVDCHAVVFVCDIDSKNGGPKATAIAKPPSGIIDMDQKYIVESEGDLLLVIRFRGGQIFDPEELWDDRQYYTIGFSVYRLDRQHGHSIKGVGAPPHKFTYVDSLGDRALFLGLNASVSMPSSEFVRANCIYFTDDNGELYVDEADGGGQDMGVFDMERGTVEPHHGSQFRSPLTPPLWFL